MSQEACCDHEHVKCTMAIAGMLMVTSTGTVGIIVTVTISFVITVTRADTRYQSPCEGSSG